MLRSSLQFAMIAGALKKPKELANPIVNIYRSTDE
jgi:hypothetical protein